MTYGRRNRSHLNPTERNPKRSSRSSSDAFRRERSVRPDLLLFQLLAFHSLSFLSILHLKKKPPSTKPTSTYPSPSETSSSLDTLTSPLFPPTLLSDSTLLFLLLRKWTGTPPNGEFLYRLSFSPTRTRLRRRKEKQSRREERETAGRTSRCGLEEK